MKWLLATLGLTATLAYGDYNEDHWYCTIRVCLADPDQEQCRPSIRKFHEEVARGHPIPDCPGSNTAFTVALGQYPACPAGMAPAQVGEVVAQMFAGNPIAAQGDIARSEMSEGSWGDEDAKRACVSGAYREVDLGWGSPVHIYPEVQWLRREAPRPVMRVFNRGGEGYTDYAY